MGQLMDQGEDLPGGEVPGIDEDEAGSLLHQGKAGKLLRVVNPPGVGPHMPLPQNQDTLPLHRLYQAAEEVLRIPRFLL